MTIPRPFGATQFHHTTALSMTLGQSPHSRAFHAKMPVPDQPSIDMARGGGAGISPLKPNEIITRLEEIRKKELAEIRKGGLQQNSLFADVRDLWPQIQSMQAIEPFLESEIRNPHSSYILSCMLYLRFADFLSEDARDYVKQEAESIVKNTFVESMNMARNAAVALVHDFRHSYARHFSEAAYTASNDEHYLGRLIAASFASMAYKYGYENVSLARTIERSLSDDDVLVVYEASESYGYYKPRSISENELFSRPSKLMTRSSSFGIDRYHYVTGMRARPRFSILSLFYSNPVKEAYVPTTSIRPIHSLADYQPDSDLRKNVMEDAYNRLQQLIDKHGLDRKKLLSKFFCVANDDNIYPPLVVRFGPSQYYLGNGHHRVAAFIKAALDGLIPHEWLNKPIPVRRVDYNHPDMPLQLARYFLTLGVKLSWQDLFPGGTDFTGLPELTERGFARES